MALADEPSGTVTKEVIFKPCLPATIAAANVEDEGCPNRSITDASPTPKTDEILRAKAARRAEDSDPLIRAASTLRT